jgi:hypothetical protein
MTDAEMIKFLPPGYRFELLLAAYLKYALTLEDDPRNQLDTLEALEKLGTLPTPVEAIKEIEPMPGVGIQIMHTAFQADRDRGGGMKNCSASYAVLTRDDVFGKLIHVNPSLMRAIALYNRR